MTLFRTLLLPPRCGRPHQRSGAGRSRPRASQPGTAREPSAHRAPQGRSMPLPQLERRVMPFMGGADYLGPELNGDTYRFKFMQNGRVIWVDVDGQGRDHPPLARPLIARSRAIDICAAASQLFRISNFSSQRGLTARR